MDGILRSLQTIQEGLDSQRKLFHWNQFLLNLRLRCYRQVQVRKASTLIRSSTIGIRQGQPRCILMARIDPIPILRLLGMGGSSHRNSCHRGHHRHTRCRRSPQCHLPQWELFWVSHS